MAFIQIIEWHGGDDDALRTAQDEWEAATEGKRTSRRSIMTQDRDDPERRVLIVFFDSYESAEENSNLPETQALSATMGGLIDGAPTFSNLDVMDDSDS